MSKRIADLIVETLQTAGVKTCYGIVGDTLNRIAHAIDRSEIDWVHMRHEEAGAFAAGAEALLTGRLTACAGTCGPGSLHFINGLYEANRNRAPVILIATQILRRDLGFQSIQEIDFNDIRTTLQALYAIYDNCNSLHTNAYDEAITTPTEESVRRAQHRKLVRICPEARARSRRQRNGEAPVGLHRCADEGPVRASQGAGRKQHEIGQGHHPSETLRARTQQKRWDERRVAATG